MLRSALASWPGWTARLSAEPRIVETLNSGRSHTTYLLVGDQQQFALRLENPQSRALAMTKTQEVALMRAAGHLAPAIVWSDERTLVTEFIRGTRWQPLENLPALCLALHHLHSRRLDLPTFNLAHHCDDYWKKILASDIVPSATTQAVFAQGRALLDNVLRAHPEQVVCHNDLNADNIFCRDDGFVFLDWEYACYNSPYFDLATLAEFFYLDERQTAQLSAHYWNHVRTQFHSDALQGFRVAVRFTEWLWLLLKQDPHSVDEKRLPVEKLRTACELRLRHLLKLYGQ